MIFFQQSASADKGMTPRDIGHGRYDTPSARCSRRCFGCGALVAGAALLAHNGVGHRGFRRRRLPRAR